ncbi:MAG TPA: hypothetical protein VKG26_05480 [Bacteroidia bacterium]|nr:hypothetical protein [Bacteroidia bacterium]
MKRKRIILVCIILFPSLLYFLFELTQANFKKMAYYGPKTVSAKGDTIYYSVPDISFITNCKASLLKKIDNEGNEVVVTIIKGDSTLIDTTNYPVYIILFLDSGLKNDGYKLKAFIDYVQYKAKELKDVPVFFVSDCYTAFKYDITNKELKGDFDSLKINLPSFHPLLTEGKKANEAYFKGKPYYVFNYFAVLIDKHRHIRGYYDPNQNSEVKRLIQEYKHLKTKDEYANTLKQNDLEQK